MSPVFFIYTKLWMVQHKYIRSVTFIKISLLTLSATWMFQPLDARCRTPNRSAELSWMEKLGEL